MRRAMALVLLSLLAACGAVPEARQKAAPRRAQLVYAAHPEARACLASLGRSSANFTPLPDQYYGAGCATLNAVRLSAVASDTARLGVSNLGPVACPLASSFAAWARYGVDRAARQIMGSPLVRIETMGSYNCRTVAGSDRLSAHARAEAIDVAAFVLADGRRISVLRDWTAGEPQTRAFLQTVHASACKRFGTVLGPAYNAAHRDHLHLELSGKAFCP